MVAILSNSVMQKKMDGLDLLDMNLPEQRNWPSLENLLREIIPPRLPSKSCRLRFPVLASKMSMVRFSLAEYPTKSGSGHRPITIKSCEGMRKGNHD